MNVCKKLTTPLPRREEQGSGSSTFLSLVAEDLYRECDGDFRHLTIVFPNKRASLFFNQHLVRISQQPIWSPRYLTISELFQQQSSLTLADPILLVCILYQVYLRISGKSSETVTLDHFYSWGEMMLADFDDIDNNLASAELLFHNMEELDELTSFEFLNERQVAAIQQFFENFNPQSRTELKEKFLSVWNLLLPIYQAFREELRQRGYAYEGMMKREETELAPQVATTSFAFVGFNVLGTAEKRLFKRIKENATKTYFYWDFDIAYLNNGHEAGRFIQENIQTFGSQLPLDHDCYNNLSRPKNITFVSAPTENAQARFAGEWMDGVLQQEIAESQRTGEPTPPLNQSAIVLCNESLLQSLLHSIPNQYLLNVTMGFPMQQTLVSTYLQALLDFQLHAEIRPNVWRYTPVINILKHPYTHLMASDAANTILDEIRVHNILYPNKELFSRDPFLSLVFTQQYTNADLLQYLNHLIQLLGRQFRDQASDKRFQHSIDAESLFNAHTMLNRLQTIHESNLLNVSRETLARFLRQMIQEKAIPFHGEPAIGLQVMGVLETRNLDFRNLTILSLNEGNLPKATYRPSFIPYNLREAYGMTTIERQTSLYAYYFYRLIQRAENITLLYNNSTTGSQKGEMSRFMMQLLTEGNLAAKPSLLTLTATGQQPTGTVALQVEKTAEVRQRLLQNYHCKGTAHASILSPSAINTYLNCPLQFYFQYVADLRTEEELDEEVGNNIFGNIFHHCMEHIYRDIFGLGHDLQSHQLYALANNRPAIEKIVDRAFNQEFFHLPPEELDRKPHYNGEQQLNREVLITYVQNQLHYDATLCPLTIVSVEDNSHMQTIDVEGTTVQLGGIIDRIDRITLNGQRQLRIVDYKTSALAQTANTLDDMFDSSKPKRPYHILQTFYYADILTESIHEPVAPSLMYVKLAKGKQPSPILQLKDANGKAYDIQDFAQQCKREFHDKLTACIGNIFDPSVPFTQTPTGHACQWCEFAELCKRKR